MPIVGLAADLTDEKAGSVPGANILTTIGIILVEIKNRNGIDFLLLLDFVARSMQTKWQVQTWRSHYVTTLRCMLVGHRNWYRV